jgi:hypothetical protein
MAKIYRFRPSHALHESEQVFATAAAQLPEDWIVVWSYSYQDESGQNREGDFLVFAPDLGIAVIEIKSGALHVDTRSGAWNTSHGDDPFTQLGRETNGVLRRLKSQQAQAPWVAQFLCLPNQDLPIFEHYKHHPRSLFLGRNDLPALRDLIVASLDKAYPNQRAAATPELFLKAFVPENSRDLHLLHPAESLDLQRLTDSHLSQLRRSVAENRRLLVRGPAGSGKTFFGLYEAIDGLKRGEQVLFLCYNRNLAEFLDGQFRRFQSRIGGSGRVDVLTWEDLLKRSLGEAFPCPPEGARQRTAFYDETLPALARQFLASGRVQAQWDRLVVDEAQDLDTASPGAQPGWWDFILAQIHQPEQARICVCLDAEQRPIFRSGVFDLEALQQRLHPVTRVQLFQRLRCTRQIARFLDKLNGEEHPPHPSLPPGLPVETLSIPKAKMLETALEVIQHWIDEHKLAPHEILLLDQPGKNDPGILSSCGEGFGHWPISPAGQTLPGHLRAGSCLKSKGLEASAVLLLGVSLDPESSQRDALITGASRARQLLTVLTAST